MEIRNRMANVVKLRCNACQDFLGMVVKPGWQEKLYAIAKDAVENNHYADNYIAAYEKMRDLGVSNYQVTDMDVSFITQVVRFCSRVVSVQKPTKDALIKLKADRNLTDHSNENEEDEELYLRALLALCDLRNFVRVVDKFEVSIPDSERLIYRRKYLPAIDELQELLDDERIQLIQNRKGQKRDIQRVLESKEPDRIWSDVKSIYTTKFLSVNKDWDAYWSFIIQAAESGVIQAYSNAAHYYYDKGEYDRAEYYLNSLHLSKEKMNYTVIDMMVLASIYFNHMPEKNGDGVKIIDELISDGYDIVKSEDGTRYDLISKSVAQKGKFLYSIHLIDEKMTI